MTGVATDPGRLNRRLVLEAPVETPDGTGGMARTYQVVATLWAAVEPVSARAEVAASTLGAAVTHRIRIRFSADITLRHRFRDGASVLRIVAMRAHEKRFLDIDAEERTD
jgi:SPP1 family predicted phage head-tail adaptor